MEIRKATEKDLEALFTFRMEFIKDMRNHEITIPEEFQHSTYEFMKEHLADDSLSAWIAVEEDEIIASVIVSYYQILPVMSNPFGKNGYVLNVFTCPEYRRHGIATKLLKLMLQEAKERNVGKLYLSATEMGMLVYKKLGFEVLTNEMVYKTL